MPNTKYVNIYTDSTSYTSSNLQHALTETSGWYGDDAFFVNSYIIWFIRGGFSYDNSTIAGVFYFGGDGNGYCDNSFRPTIVK